MDLNTLNITEHFTYALSNNVFMTFLPGEIIFGVCDKSGNIEDNKSFKFSYNEYFELYKSLVEIIKFFNLTNDDEAKGCLKQVNDFTYYWSGLNVMQNNEIKKCVKIGLESFNENFQVLFNEKEILQFIFVLKNCMISSLYFHTDVSIVIHKLSKESLENIEKFNSDFGLKFIKQTLKIQNKNYAKLNQIFDVIKYYLNFIIIIHKLEFFDKNIIQENENQKKQLLSPEMFQQ